MDKNLYISVILNVFVRYPRYSLAILSSVVLMVCTRLRVNPKNLTTVFNTVPAMCFRFMFRGEDKIKTIIA